jgi:hypothetical protein
MAIKTHKTKIRLLVFGVRVVSTRMLSFCGSNCCVFLGFFANGYSESLVALVLINFLLRFNKRVINPSQY